MKKIIIIAGLALAGCASTPDLIVGPATDASGKQVAPPSPVLTGIASDIQAAAFNLDNAIAIGVLPANDPADACAHQALQQAGIEVPAGAKPAQSFAPKHGSPLADASVLYILAQQAKSGPSFSVDVGCKALLGQMVLDGLGAVNKLLPGQIFQKLQ